MKIKIENLTSDQSFGSLNDGDWFIIVNNQFSLYQKCRLSCAINGNALHLPLSGQISVDYFAPDDLVTKVIVKEITLELSL